MKRTLIAVAAALSLIFASITFAVEDIQPSASTAPDFEKMKADYLKRLDTRMSSLQQEKTCVEAAKNQGDLKTCRQKNRASMKTKRGFGDQGGQVPPIIK